MPGRYMNEAKQFKDDLRNAGFTVGMSAKFVEPIARELGVSTKHVQNMMCGHNRAGQKVLTKLQSLIDEEAGKKELPVQPIDISVTEVDEVFYDKQNKRLYISEDIIKPIISEMIGAIEGAIFIENGKTPVISVHAVMRWCGNLREHMTKKS